MTENPPLGSSRKSASGRRLMSVAWKQLKSVPGVAALPLLGGTIASIMFIVFGGPGIIYGVVGVPDDHTRTIVLTIAIAIGAIAATIASVYFQGAVVSAALQQSAGQPTSLSQALAGARARRGRLFQWGFVTATVSVLLSLLRDRNNLFTTILSAAGGLAWSVATYLALPVVVAEGAGPIDAVKRSASLLKKTWGNALRVTVRFTLVLLPAILLAILVILAGIVVLAAVNEIAGVVLIVIGALILVIALAITSSLSSYITAQLYLYASGSPTAIPAELVRGAVVVA